MSVKENKPADKKADKRSGRKLSVARFFREIKAEFKKIVWPTRKHVAQNTTIVLIVVAIMGLIIAGFDALLTSALQFFINLF